MTSSQAPADLATRRAGKLTDTVYASLRDDIYAFRLLPGDRFAENDVAERLQVSRTPVREALMRLQSEGLVRGHFRNGWEVVPIDLARFASLYELREMLELHAVRKLCSPRIAPGVRQQLVAEQGAIWQCAPSDRLPDGLAVAALDEAFHCALVQAAGNPEADTVYRQLANQLRIMRRLDFAYGDCIDDTYAEHRAILDAIARSDAALAGELIARHIEDSHTVVERLTIARLEQVRAESVQAAPVPGNAPAATPTRRKRFG
ncbi:GntR family transcriptional regulator [Herbaspirillum huttiense]|uniref:GntR family transcriptional regulator n=1 Tax=Herbaspirillum huttiense TaxID=863372 RepID=UPI002E762BAE|nr:GntR family transcriptional regulator [Herbaspirillum huttiense]MEE1639259.1 GntR family transcriptional regulator [Herbaspirillum huttiense NC40101]